MANADIGPTGRVVADNVKRFRRAAGLTLRDVEGLLRQAGRPIHLTGLFRIEKCERRVDVDELAALALILGVTPTRLLSEYAAEDRLSTGQIEKHREGLDAFVQAAEAVISAGLPMRGVLTYGEMALIMAALEKRPDLQDMYARFFDVGEPIPSQLLPMALQSGEIRAEAAQRQRDRTAELEALLRAGDPRVEYHPGTGPGTDSYTFRPGRGKGEESQRDEQTGADPQGTAR